MLVPTRDIKEFVVTNFAPDVPAEELDEDFDLLDSGLINSLGLVKLVTQLSRRFDIDVDAADIRPDHFRSVAAIERFIAEQKPS